MPQPDYENDLVFPPQEIDKPKIGDLYKGGVYVGEYNGKEVVFCLTDEPEGMSWYEAQKIENRRLPTNLEWFLYLENKEIIDNTFKKNGEIPDKCYWSSSEYYSNHNSYAWVVYADNGVVATNNKGFYYSVRCVLKYFREKLK